MIPLFWKQSCILFVCAVVLGLGQPIRQRAFFRIIKLLILELQQKKY